MKDKIEFGINHALICIALLIVGSCSLLDSKIRADKEESLERLRIENTRIIRDYITELQKKNNETLKMYLDARL
jgi:hypothetical protein